MAKIIEVDLFEYKKGISRYVKSIQDDCAAKVKLAEEQAAEAYKMYEDAQFDLVRVLQVNYRQKRLLNKINKLKYEGKMSEEKIQEELMELSESCFYLKRKR